MGLLQNFGRWINRMIFGVQTIEDALNVKIIVDKELELQRELWDSMMRGKASWNSEEVPSLRLASGISKEASRYTTFELQTEIKGSPRAEFLNEQYKNIVNTKLQDTTSLVSGGSIIFKPAVFNGKIINVTVPNNCYYPIRLNELGEIVSVVFAATFSEGDKSYTLLEVHDWKEKSKKKYNNATKEWYLCNEYTIKYYAFINDGGISSGLGKPVELTKVEKWKHLKNVVYEDIPQPIFVECKMPDMRSIFADAIEIIREADKQLGMTIREYNAGRIRTFASMDLFKMDEKGNLKLPDNEDTFVVLDSEDNKFTIQNFAPNLRDDSLFRALNEYKRIIEFVIGFAYGIISDPNQIEKTAEEVRAGKQRFLVTIQSIQKIMGEAYKKLVASMDILTTIYKLAPEGEYDLIINWGDSIMEDFDKEYNRLKDLVTMGIMKPEVLVAYVRGITEEQALNQMPDMAEESPI